MNNLKVIPKEGTRTSKEASKKAVGKFAIVGLALIILISFIFLVSALTQQEELAQLENELNYQGWNKINMKNKYNNNFMLSIDNKILT